MTPLSTSTTPNAPVTNGYATQAGKQKPTPNADTLIGKTDDGRYWYFTREHRILAWDWQISKADLRKIAGRLRPYDVIGCVYFFEVA